MAGYGEDRVCTGEGAEWGRMSEAVKVGMGMCQLARWEYPLKVQPEE